MVFSPFPDYHDPNSNWLQQLEYQHQPSFQDGSSSTPGSGSPIGGPHLTNGRVSMADLARILNIPRPAPVNCPREMCGSHNTKFCYYNNRSFAQARYWCRSCRRHWTHGGSIRSIPSGGNRRGSRHPRTLSSARTTPYLGVTPLALGMENYYETVAAPPVLARFPFEFQPSFDDIDGGFDENLGFDEFGNPNY